MCYRAMTLAQSRVGKVELCTECGAISLHVGPITMRFQGDGFREVVSMLREALSCLDRIQSKKAGQA
ncbi:MAG: hypothetical protein N2515_01645 [Deltaproteobacteria bacterium]|nr:hypothetical protein [Deltaproteobacteria bacterium]